ADRVVINKVGTAEAADLATVEANVAQANPSATVVRAESPVTVVDPDAVKGKRVLVVEDGPTLTHGEMRYGAAHVAARQFGAAEIVDPRPYAQGTIKGVFEKYYHLTDILPAVGYGDAQMKDMEETINQTPCDLVLIGTPIDLGRLLSINKPWTRVLYELKEENPEIIRAAVVKAVR
ncbi:MAG: GTPase, partial [Planctomycetes bacterium]|nr:GTPase [Planctomycetota bacterium]